MSTTKDLNVFQIVTMAVFLVVGVAGIILFATNKVGSGSRSYKAIVWGVLPKETIDASLASYSVQGIDPNFIYTEFPEEGFDQVILQAVAEGRGPDAIVFPDTMYFGQVNKLVTIPTETISARTYADTYIDAANQFAVQGGIKAFPLVIDPLVMYYNKDMFTSAGILTPPRSWKELSDITNKITRKRDDGVLDRATVALGEYTNITYAKRILYTLFAQAGVRMSFFDAGASSYASGLVRSTIAENAAGLTSAADRTSSVLSFYTDFANPLKPNYTWNRSFSSSRDAFLSQNLAVYFAPGSEVQYILSHNPNLNFSIAPVPQENRDVKAVHGKTYALGFLITSQHTADAYAEVTKYFTADTMIQGLADAMQVAPAKRTLLANAKSAKNSTDLAVVYESAVYASTWMDPEVDASETILQTLVESITSGKQALSESVQDASDRLNRLYGSR
jgi:ABC-type glycerol-3-phosphate transport system substrate-binding protein